MLSPSTLLPRSQRTQPDISATHLHARNPLCAHREHEANSVQALCTAASAAAKGTLGPPLMLYQPLFVAPEGQPPFNCADIAFSKSYVDYLLLTPKRDDASERVVVECTVIDAKATDHVKIGAMVQVHCSNSHLVTVTVTATAQIGAMV